MACGLDLREDQALPWRSSPTNSSPTCAQILFTLGEGAKVFAAGFSAGSGHAEGRWGPSCPSGTRSGRGRGVTVGLGSLGSAGIRYTPGCGPELALMSARRKRPAVCNIPPRPLCSPVGSWPGEQHWQRDLMDEGKKGVIRSGDALRGSDGCLEGSLPEGSEAS